MQSKALKSASACYIQHCRVARSLSRNTILAYQQDLICFIKYFSSQKTVKIICSSVVLSYKTFLIEEKKLSPSSVRRRVLTLKSFCLWLNKSDQLACNPFDDLVIELKLPKRLPRPIDRSIVRKVLSSVSKDRGISESLTVLPEMKCSRITEDFTNSIVIQVLISTGIRIGELTSIRLLDILDDGRIIRIHGKGNKERNVYIENRKLVKDICLYKKLRAEMGSSNDYLLVNRNGAPLTAQAMRRRFKMISKENDIKPHLTPHQFRHTAATLLIEEGVDIRLVQRLLGHSSITTTELYTHVSDKSLKLAIRNADPLGLMQS